MFSQVGGDVLVGQHGGGIEAGDRRAPAVPDGRAAEGGGFPDGELQPEAAREQLGGLGITRDAPDTQQFLVEVGNNERGLGVADDGIKLAVVERV